MHRSIRQHVEQFLCVWGQIFAMSVLRSRSLLVFDNLYFHRHLLVETDIYIRKVICVFDVILKKDHPF